MANMIEMPKLGFDMAEGTLVNWAKAEGDQIKKGEVIADIETDKATVQVESPFDGIVYKHLVEIKKNVPVGTPIAIISAAGEEVDLKQFVQEKTEAPVSPPIPSAPAVQPLPSEEKLISTQADDSVKKIKASPIAKTMAEEAGIEISKVKGSGPEGRIVKRDIEAFLEKPSKTTGTEEPSPAESLGDETHEMNKLRLTIGRRMTESKQTIPHFYLTHSYDVAYLLMMRRQMNEGVEEEDLISINDFIVRSTALALRQYPALNATLDNTRMIVRNHINIGVAVSVENGLMIVVCRDADKKSIKEVSSEIKLMSARAREGRVLAEDIEGSTFTISNLGMFDVENFAAIINPPEAAILAVSSIQTQPVVVNGNVTVGQRMKMTLSADHRVVDGVQAAEFMQTLAKFIEQPWRVI